MGVQMRFSSVRRGLFFGRLFFKHVKRRSRNLSAFHRFIEILFIDNAAAARS